MIAFPANESPPGRMRQLTHRVSPATLGSRLLEWGQAVWRRQGWLLENASPRSLANIAANSVEYLLKRERLRSWPVVVKIDISPQCNLACTICVHADANGNPVLEHQEFNGRQRMSVENYRRIINQIRGRSSAVSLYYLGDPLVHPDLDEMCSIARDARLNVHISTNFSFKLSDERIRRFVTSGLTHLTVCVDGLSQANYEKTRVGGRIDWVLSNLRRVCEVRRGLRLRFPKIEVQFIKFRHNIHELEDARRLFLGLGVDQLTDFWGALTNYTDHNPGRYGLNGPKQNRLVPQCIWPYALMVVKYNGDVIPCCTYRQGEQYNPAENHRLFGNVFADGLRTVWNSKPYRMARRFVSNPQSVRTNPSLEDHFCHGCGKIYATDGGDLYPRGDSNDFESYYALDTDGRPVRRPAEEFEGVRVIGLPSGRRLAV